MSALWKLPMLCVFGFLAVMLVRYVAAEEAPDIARAHVDRVIDGDSIEVTATIWIDQTVRETVRLRGVDTPEIHGKCPAERWAALQAKQWLKARVEGSDVDLTQIGREKYGRILSAVLKDGVNVGDEMIAARLARAYSGLGPRGSWC